MKKICILSAVNIKHMSMISMYTDKLDEEGIEYDIIYMDKYGIDEDINARTKYVFRNPINHSNPRIVKALQYFKFRGFATRILTENSYGFVIVWNDIAIFMFSDVLVRKFPGKYCLNIRDYLRQQNGFVYNRFKKAIEGSAFTTISSNGFKTFLPDYDYITVHSLNNRLLKNVEPNENFQQLPKPIRITFLGNVRFFDINKKLLEVFKNDPRFELHFYGTNGGVLETFALEEGISNTKFYDSFPVEDTPKFIEQMDLVNNLYGNNSVALKHALSIKLYYGVYKRCPILVNSDTYGAEIVSKYGIGYVVSEVNEELPDNVFDWYRNLNFNQFDENCERFLRDIRTENGRFEARLREVLL